MKPIIAILLFLFTTIAHGQRYIDTDYVRNTSRTVVLSLPSTSSTIVGTSATQTLTNKTLEGGTVSGSTLAGALSLTGILSGGTISGTTIAGGSFSGVDNSFILKDNSDNTKQLMFELSGVTTGNVRTMTVPDWSGTLVTAATSQTLENKSVSAPSIINYMTFEGSGAIPTPAASNANLYYSGSSMRFVNSGGTTYKFSLNEGTNNFTGSNTFNAAVGFNGLVSAAGGINISGGNPGVSPTSGVTLYNPGTNQLAFKGIANVQQILASSEAANEFNQGFSASQTVTINGSTVTVSGTSLSINGATLGNLTTLGGQVSGAATVQLMGTNTISGTTTLGAATHNGILTMNARINVASGTGIAYPGYRAPTTAGSSVIAANLNEFQYGTWTPIFHLSTSQPTVVTYGTQSGSYTKMGNRVCYDYFVSLTAFTAGSGAGNVYVSGTPFTVSATGSSAHGGVVTTASVWNTTYPTALQGVNNSNALALVNTVSSTVSVTRANMSTTTTSGGTGCYTTNQ